jgi:hypothetical protein
VRRTEEPKNLFLTSRKQSGKRDFKPIKAIKNLLQDERLSPIALILLRPFPALFHPVPPQFAGIRAGGAHTGHMNGQGLAIAEFAKSASPASCEGPTVSRL